MKYTTHWVYLFAAVVTLTSCNILLVKRVVNRYHEYAGVPFPDMVLENETDSIISFSSLQGKVIYLNLWGTWCTACIQEFPALAKLNDKLFNGY